MQHQDGLVRTRETPPYDVAQTAITAPHTCPDRAYNTDRQSLRPAWTFSREQQNLAWVTRSASALCERMETV
jgi:hypothetical protein